MTDRLADVSLRILGPADHLLGAGDIDSLENIDTTELPNGSSIWVNSSRAEFRLYKDDNATPPDGTNVIKPASGPGRWFIQVNTGTGIQVENMVGLVLPQRPLLQTEGLHPVDTGTAIQLLDGEVDALAYASLSAAVAANTGRTIRLIDGTHIVDADLLDPTVTFRMLQGAVLSVPVSRTIAAAIDLSAGGTIVVAAAATVTHAGAIVTDGTQQIWYVSAGGSVVLGPDVLTAVSPVMFGGDPTGVADSSDAIEAATAALLSSVATAGPLAKQTQPTLDFGPGVFRFTRQLAFTRLRGMIVKGAGTWATTLWWDGSLATTPLVVVGATNTSPIVYETSTPHNLADNDPVTVSGMIGAGQATKWYSANRRGLCTVVDPTHFSINGSVSNDTWVSGGQVFTAQHGVDAALLFFNCRDMTVEEFTVNVNSTETNPPLMLIDCRGDASDPQLNGFVATKPTFRHLILARGGYGLVYSYAAGAPNANNEYATTQKVIANNQTVASFALGLGPGGSAGSNLKGMNFYECEAVGNPAGGARYGLIQWGGWGNWYGGFVRDFRAPFTKLNGAAVAATVLIVDSTANLHAGSAVAFQELDGTRNVFADPLQWSTTIVSIDSPTQITVLDAVTAVDRSFVVDDQGDAYAAFACCSANQGTDGMFVDGVYSEACAHLYMDAPDLGFAANVLPFPVEFRNCEWPNSFPGTDNFACVFKRSEQGVVGGTFGNFSFPPARFQCIAAGVHPSNFYIHRLKLFGGPLAGGGFNASNTEHLVKIGWAIVDDLDHIFGNGTSNPVIKDNRPSRPTRVDTADDLRAIIPPLRFDRTVVTVSSLNGRPLAWNSATPAGAWDDGQVQIRPTDLALTDPGMWNYAAERTFAVDVDHLRKVNAGQNLYADLGFGVDPLDSFGGSCGWSDISTAAEDGFLINAPSINGVVSYRAENDITTAGGWAHVNSPDVDFETMADTLDVAPTAHSITYNIVGLDTSGTVETEYCIWFESVPGSPITHVQPTVPGAWTRVLDIAAGTSAAGGTGGKPEMVAVAPGGFIVRFRCKATDTHLTIYMATTVNVYIGTGTGRVKVRRVMVHQARTAAGRFVQQQIDGSIGNPLADADETILVTDGANRVDSRARKTADRITTLGAAGAVAGSRIVCWSLDRTPYKRTYHNSVGAQIFQTTPGVPVKLTFAFTTEWQEPEILLLPTA